MGYFATEIFYLFISEIFLELALANISSLKIVKEFEYAPRPLPLTFIMSYPNKDNLYLASTSTAVLSLSESGQCTVMLGKDSSLVDDCIESSSAGESIFQDILQLEHAQPWPEDSNKFAETVIIVDFLGDAVWLLNLDTGDYYVVAATMENYASSWNRDVYPTHLSKMCSNGAGNGDYWLYIENEARSRTRYGWLDVSRTTNNLVNTVRIRNSTHFFFYKSDLHCTRTALIPLHNTIPFTHLNRYVWMNETMLFLDADGHLYNNNSQIPIPFTFNNIETVNSTISMTNQLSLTSIVAVLENTNKILVLAMEGEDTGTYHQHVYQHQYKLMATGYACQTLGIIKHWFPVKSLESCIYSCVKMHLKCSAVDFDEREQLCQLHAIILGATVVRPGTVCILRAS